MDCVEKPVALIRAFLQQHAKEGENVVDLITGKGQSVSENEETDNTVPGGGVLSAGLE